MGRQRWARQLGTPECHTEDGIKNLSVRQRGEPDSTVTGVATGTGLPPFSQRGLGQSGRSHAERERGDRGTGCMGLWPVEETGPRGGGEVGDRHLPLDF